MSVESCPNDTMPSGIDDVILPRAHDIGGFEVHRALPATQRQMVGPFIFFDQMGPGEFLTGKGLDVRPHPHVGLSTVTYLFDGAIQHRDSLGSDQSIVPGDDKEFIPLPELRVAAVPAVQALAAGSPTS